MLILNQVFILFILIAVGFFIGKTGMVNKTGVSQMSSILMYIVSPCVIIISFQQHITAELVQGLLISAASAVTTHIIGIAVSMLVFNKKWPEPYRRILRFATVYSNSGFMGLPLLQAVLGAKGVIYGSVYISVFDIFCWTHGVMLFMSGDPSHQNESKARLFVKSVLNPNVMAMAAGILLFAFSVSLPADLYDALNYISDINTPFSMIVIGAMLIDIDFKSFLLDKYLWPGIIMRNLVMPLIMLAVLRIAGLSGSMLTACLLQVTCPVAGLCAIFAEKYNSDTGFTAKLMAVSTLMSIFTIPFMLFLSNLT